MTNLNGSFIKQAIILFIQGYNIEGNNYTFNDLVDILTTSNSSYKDEVKNFTRAFKQLKAYELDKNMDMNIELDYYCDTYITFWVNLDKGRVICRSICVGINDDYLYSTIITKLTGRFKEIVKAYEEYLDEHDWREDPDIRNYCLAEKIKSINKEIETIRTEAIMELIKSISNKEE